MFLEATFTENPFADVPTKPTVPSFAGIAKAPKFSNGLFLLMITASHDPPMAIAVFPVANAKFCASLSATLIQPAPKYPLSAQSTNSSQAFLAGASVALTLSVHRKTDRKIIPVRRYPCLLLSLVTIMRQDQVLNISHMLVVFDLDLAITVAVMANVGDI